MGPQWRVLGYSSYTYTCNLLALATQGKIKEHWLPATWQAIATAELSLLHMGYSLCPQDRPAAHAALAQAPRKLPPCAAPATAAAPAAAMGAAAPADGAAAKQT